MGQGEGAVFGLIMIVSANPTGYEYERAVHGGGAVAITKTTGWATQHKVHEYDIYTGSITIALPARSVDELRVRLAEFRARRETEAVAVSTTMLAGE